MPDHHEPIHSAMQHLVLAMRIANRAVIADIESEGQVVTLDGTRHYDVRPMIDLREHPPTEVDMAREAICYALDAGLVAQHLVHAHLLRIVHPLDAL